MYTIKCVNMIYIPCVQLAVGRVLVVDATEMKSGRHCETNSVPSHPLSSLI